MKRILSMLLLLAFAASWASPCQAAFMRCGMEMPAPEKPCGSCDADDPGTPRLTQGTCCSVEPGREREEIPALVSASPPGQLTPEKAFVTPAAASAADALVLRSNHTVGDPEATGPPPRPTGSTVLRL